ncbi:hypothetical protein Dimus_004006, partial [Dionaea muscipula]
MNKPLRRFHLCDCTLTAFMIVASLANLTGDLEGLDATADSMAPDEVVVDEASKIVEEEVIKTTEAINKAGLEEAVEIAKAVVANVVEEMSLVAKDMDTLTIAIQEKIPRSIQANTDYLEATVKEAAEETKTRFELMESKLKVTELDLNINFNLKIAKTEENLSQKIDENSTRLSSVDETL